VSMGENPLAVRRPAVKALAMATRLVPEIKRRMEALQFNPRSLSLKAGLNETAIRDIVEGTDPKVGTVEKIAKALGCTIADLLAERRARAIAPLADGDMVAISELDVHIAAGPGSADDMQGLMTAHEHSAVIGIHSYPASSFREAFSIDPGRVRIVAVRGDSMEPRLWSGQRVMVDIDDKTPSPPGIFVIWDGLGLVIKRVEVIAGSDPLRVRLTSANPAYAPYERTIEEAHINGRVIGTWSRT
jgi:SOS-response transcriptional repressor LexA